MEKNSSTKHRNWRHNIQAWAARAGAHWLRGTASIAQPLALLPILMMTAGALADDRNTCFAVKGSDIVAQGDVFRQALLARTNTAVNGATALSTKTLPDELTACKDSTQAAPISTNYYGYITNKAKLLSFVNTACGGGGRQYFSLGKAVYYRDCAGGAGNNYIYFWGMENGTRSTCFGSTYPEMYTEFTGANNNKAPTADQMKAVYGGNMQTANQGDYALGNMMAAVLISEAARDYLVVPENYMLIDLLAAGKTTAVQIIGGHCAQASPRSSCGNTAQALDGAHPLAWGGAQAAMMTGGWGTNNGATSDFGKGFENDLILSWLKNKALVQSGSGCTPGKLFTTYTQPQQSTINKLFDSLF